jgi:hypothetical protein
MNAKRGNYANLDTHILRRYFLSKQLIGENISFINELD